MATSKETATVSEGAEAIGYLKKLLKGDVVFFEKAYSAVLTAERKKTNCVRCFATFVEGRALLQSKTRSPMVYVPALLLLVGHS